MLPRYQCPVRVAAAMARHRRRLKAASGRRDRNGPGWGEVVHIVRAGPVLVRQQQRQLDPGVSLASPELAAASPQFQRSIKLEQAKLKNSYRNSQVVKILRLYPPPCRGNACPSQYRKKKDKLPDFETAITFSHIYNPERVMTARCSGVFAKNSKALSSALWHPYGL